MAEKKKVYKYYAELMKAKTIDNIKKKSRYADSGIPVIAPGERVEKKTVAYLDRIGYNRVEAIETVPPMFG